MVNKISLFAIFLNYYQVPISEHIATALNMGAYTSLTIQLFIFKI